MDDIDKKIINILQKDGRITNIDLAKKIGLSAGPVLKRVKSLEKRGFIKSYKAVVDNQKLGHKTTAFVAIRLSLHQLKSINKFNSLILKMPEITECYHVAGEFDFLLKVVTQNIDTYKNFLVSKLVRVPGIRQVETFFVFSTVKSDGVISVF